MYEIICFLFIGKFQPQFDIDQLKTLIFKVVDQHYDKLSGLFQFSLSIANKMFQEGLINNEVLDNPTGKKIIDEFKKTLDFIDKQSQVESHCKSLLKVFDDHGGSFKQAAEMLKSKWLKTAQDGMVVDLNLD